MQNESHDSSNLDEATAGGGEGEAAGRPAAASPSFHRPQGNLLDLAVPVTRQVQISGPPSWKHLVSGVDSFDLGLYVQWNQDWPLLEKALTDGKQAAERTQGITWEYAKTDGCLIQPNGKRPMYAFHLQTADFHLFIARTKNPSDQYPNLYVSILSKSLWLRGVMPAVDHVVQFIQRLGGTVERVQPSRVDLCADFVLPDGLSLDFLREHRVSRSKAQSHHVNDDRLETYYCGSASSPVRARIYDKATEVLTGGEKLWFADVWKLPAIANVWRIEFQLRRDVLKQFKIDSLTDLVERSGGAWASLTDSWLSFRLKDDDNASRRTVHPWWAAVQEVGRDFGSSLAITRDYGKGGQAPAEWYVSHAGGCLAGYAARKGINDFDSALGLFASAMADYWASRSFDERYKVERIRLGFDDTTGAV